MSGMVLTSKEEEALTDILGATGLTRALGIFFGVFLETGLAALQFTHLREKSAFPTPHPHFHCGTDGMAFEVDS